MKEMKGNIGLCNIVLLEAYITIQDCVSCRQMPLKRLLLTFICCNEFDHFNKIEKHLLDDS